MKANGSKWTLKRTTAKCLKLANATILETFSSNTSPVNKVYFVDGTPYIRFIKAKKLRHDRS